MRTLALVAGVCLAGCAARFGAASARRAPREPNAALSAQLKALLIAEGLDEITSNNSFGFWAAIVTANGTAEAQLGWSESTPATATRPARQVPAKATDIVPAGSLTKSFTAAAILQLVDRGALALDDNVADYADRFLLRVANTTLGTLYGPRMANVTIRSCLDMRHGAPAYDDTTVEKATEECPNLDIGPVEYLINDSYTPHKATGWRCGPNASMCDPPSYNSMGFVFLGLALLGQANITAWEKYDQKAVLPAALRHDPAYKGLEFFIHGTCAHYKNTAHFYLMKGPGEYVDQHGLSCLNGWGFGNIGVTAIAAAAYFWDLIGRDPQIVSPLAALEMQQFGQVLEGHHWERYGLGLMELPLQRYGEMNGNVSGIKPFEFMVGHNGADYGTYIHSGFHPTLDISVAFMLNKIDGIWVDGSKVQHDEAIFCRAWRAAFQLTGHGKLGNTSLVCNDRPWRPPF